MENYTHIDMTVQWHCRLAVVLGPPSRTAAHARVRLTADRRPESTEAVWKRLWFVHGKCVFCVMPRSKHVLR